MTDDELFPTQFRHEVVTDFLKKFCVGDTEILTDKKMKKELAVYVENTLNLIGEYVSGKWRDKSADYLEGVLFDRIMMLRTTNNIIEHKPSYTEIEKALLRLEDRMDSTNKLLQQTLAILAQLLKKGKGGG